MLHRTRAVAPSLALALALLSAPFLACGSGGDDPSSPGLVAPSPGGDAQAPLVRRDFPLATPELGGYRLEEILPASFETSLPAAIVWPAGAPPLILERGGNVVRNENGTRRNVLDISAEVALQSEGGALGLALHPAFGDGSGPKPYAYLWYNAKSATRNTQRLVRYSWDVGLQRFDPTSKLVMIEEEEEHPEHNAGRLVFGKDGFLYFGNGDDLNEANHQTVDRALFEGLFRIDVDSDPVRSHPIPRQPAGGTTTGYMIPNDNPFVGKGGLEEFYAIGLRNPFMFSFDRKTDDLWVGDVGDSFREEVHVIRKGDNGQWPVREGDLVRQSDGVMSIGRSNDPVFHYSHAEMGDLTAIFGGFVYRGRALPELEGKYVYSDWPSLRVWAFDPATKTRTTIVSNEWQRQPMAIAEDDDGEIYVLHVSGIAKLVRDAAPLDVPRRLAETKIFKDLATLTPEDDFVPYAINSPLWSDGAEKQRWVSVPAGAKLTTNADGSFRYPAGTRFVKQFDLPDAATPRGRTKHLETRVLVVGQATTYGLSYRWNAEGTDATLTPEGFDETIVDDAGNSRVWHTPSWGQCWSCHRADSRVLGFTQAQTHRDDQLRTFAERGLVEPGLLASWASPLARPGDASAPLEERALAYLAANCSGCHHAGASFTGGEETWIATPGVPLAERRLVNVATHNYPVAAGLGLTQGLAPLIKPGDPAGSLLVRRLETDNHDLMMPPLGKNVVDREGAKLIADWVASMPAN